jgi:hypothetical protein
VTGRRVQAIVAVGVLLWIAAVVIAVVLLRGDATRGPEAPPLPATVCPGPQIGVHTSLVYEEVPEQSAANVAAIHDLLHAQVARESLLWNQVEPIEGRFNWSRADRTIEQLRSAGIEPLLVVMGSPSWANGLPQSRHGHHLYVPPGGAALDTWLARYSAFLAAAVRRYHDFVRRWEIWNEPNLAVFWRPRPDPVTYRRVYETLRATILRVDPRAEVAVGGLTDLSLTASQNMPGLEFLRRFVRTHPPIDNVAIHPYTTNDHPPDQHVPGENNFDDIARVRDQLASDGERASIWVTEWGWSSAVVGEPLQARYVDRSLKMLEQRFRFVRVATYFLDHDLPPRYLQGLLDQQLEPKLAAFAFRERAKRVAARCRSAGAGP